MEKKDDINSRPPIYLSGLAVESTDAKCVGRLYHYGDGVLRNPKLFMNRKDFRMRVSYGRAPIAQFTAL